VGQLPAGKKLSTEREDNVGVRRQTTADKDSRLGNLLSAAVSYTVCELAIELQLFVGMIC
jgi:hypothetical protein